MFLFRCAYRYVTGEVEGFTGTALSSKDRAREDCMEQIRRKVDICRESFEEKRIILNPARLNAAERSVVRMDWKTNVRY
jgi:hypothetical protein